MLFESLDPYQSYGTWFYKEIPSLYVFFFTHNGSPEVCNTDNGFKQQFGTYIFKNGWKISQDCNINDEIMFTVCLLQLIPGYRGYTIDSLRKLSILDDIMISADEKHHYKGLARRRGIKFSSSVV